MPHINELNFAEVLELLQSEAPEWTEGYADWRSAILTRFVIEVPKELQPMPDGGSLEYIERAFVLGKQQRQKYHKTSKKAKLLAEVEEMIQIEIARSHINERKLISRFII